MWHHAVSQCRGIEDVETGKKHCVDPTARYPSKFHFDHLTSDWQGELGQLDQHLNLKPEKSKLFEGCAYAEVKCLYCNAPHLRHEIGQCAERPFTCSLCEEYESTYTDVVTNHSPVCKCRPVECPNSCGTNNLQHQHLEEHVSTQCPLSYMECEFSDAGCDAKVYRKDLPSHLGENMVTHMSLLARENRKLKQQLKEQEEHRDIEDKKLKQQLNKQEEKIEVQEKDVAHLLVEVRKHKEKMRHHFLPVDLCSDMFHTIKKSQPWLSKPFYNIDGHMLQLEIHLVSKNRINEKYSCAYKYRYIVLGSDFVVPPIETLHVTAYIMDEVINVINHDLEYKLFLGKSSEFKNFKVESIFPWTFRVSQIIHK